MAKDSKKQGLPKPSLETKNSTLPASVSNMPSRLTDHSVSQNFRLVFEYYDHNRCELQKLSGQNMKRVINTFSKITKHGATSISKICRPTPIKRSASGEYGNLFKNLPDDFDYLLEVYYSGNGRIFIHPFEDMCLVVAVWNEHR